MGVSRRDFLGASLAGGLGAMSLDNEAAGQQRPARRPNLVFIMTDNQGAWTLGCYGSTATMAS